MSLSINMYYIATRSGCAIFSESSMNLTPLVILKNTNSPGCRLRRNSISMPALNTIDLGAMQQTYLDSNDQQPQDVSVCRLLCFAFTRYEFINTEFV